MNNFKNIIDQPHLSATNQAEWVTEAIARGLCKPEDSWIEHALKQVKDPNLKHRKVGGFDRSEIQALYSQVERVRPQAANAQRIKDLEALERAGEVLHKLLEEERREQARPQSDPFQQVEEFRPVQDQPEPPIPIAPLSGVEEQVAAGSEPDIFQQRVPEFTIPTDEEVDRQSKLALPVAQLSAAKLPAQPAERLNSSDSGRIESASEAPEPSALVSHIKADLTDPTYIKTAAEFLANLDAARRRLNETDDRYEAMRISNFAQLLEALASAADLGADLEYEGKGLRFAALYRAARLRGEVKEGRPRIEEEREPNPFEKRELNLMAVLGKHDEESFYPKLEQAVHAKTLSEKTFNLGEPKKTPRVGIVSSKSSADNSKSKQKQAEQPNIGEAHVMHSLNGLGADFRQNWQWYLDHLEELADKPLSVENWGPVAEKAEAFFVRFFTRLRQSRKTQESEVSTPSEETTLSI